MLCEILVQEGAVVAINTVVARISDVGAGAAATAGARRQPVEAPKPAPAAPAAPVAAAPPPLPALRLLPQPAEMDADDISGPVSPLVRRMARENNIDLKSVKGTGAGGRITKQDVENYLACSGASDGGGAQPPRAGCLRRELLRLAPLPRTEPAKTRIEPMSDHARRRSPSTWCIRKRTSAHVTTVHRVDMTNVARAARRS